MVAAKSHLQNRLTDILQITLHWSLGCILCYYARNKEWTTQHNIIFLNFAMQNANVIWLSLGITRAPWKFIHVEKHQFPQNRHLHGDRTLHGNIQHSGGPYPTWRSRKHGITSAPSSDEKVRQLRSRNKLQWLRPFHYSSNILLNSTR